MKQASFFVYCRVLSCLIFFLALSGCISVPNSPTPRFYMLQAIDKDQEVGKFKITSGMIIGIGPVKIPEYLNRPQIVTRDKNNMLTFAQFDRWGEPLDFALGRLIRDNLIVMLPGAAFELFPWDMDVPVRYQVFIDLVQLESELKKDLFFVVQWSVFDLSKKKMMVMKRSEFRQPITPGNYSGLAKTLSAVCVSLSNDIAREVSTLVNQPEKEDDVVLAN
ncbi:MAG: PqiC family protein [Candidatus Omnitrophota bacterium]